MSDIVVPRVLHINEQATPTVVFLNVLIKIGFTSLTTLIILISK